MIIILQVKELELWLKNVLDITYLERVWAKICTSGFWLQVQGSFHYM